MTGNVDSMQGEFSDYIAGRGTGFVARAGKAGSSACASLGNGMTSFLSGLAGLAAGKAGSSPCASLGIGMTSVLYIGVILRNFAQLYVPRRGSGSFFGLRVFQNGEVCGKILEPAWSIQACLI
jgi:hypothetical protein